ncbi:MAG: OmpA family protein [Gammaproteobacteria bacterium]|nr:OmpA family protein [Gammaproteobacteria bacterium]
MDEYTQLRTYLLAAEQQRLDRLEGRLNDVRQRSREIAKVLPHALRSSAREPQLTEALQKPVDACFKHSVQQDPKTFARAILPVITPTLRNTIAESFKSIREFLQQQQQRLDVHEKHIDQLEQGNIKKLTERLAEIEQEVSQFRELKISLADIERRTRETAEILPHAIREAEQISKGQNILENADLAESLQAPVANCIRHSVQEDTNMFADALFPIMGPAIRKSINESLKALVQSINTRLEQNLSAKGLSWRMEAMRRRRPFAEVILEKTLIYRIEQVFLIHRESGLLIQHIYQETVGSATDSDAVSAMLTAIQDFIRDSFSASKTEELDSVEIGDYTVWLERGPYAVLACVIRGVAPLEFRNQMRVLLESLHARHGKMLETFAGDSKEAEPCRPLLQKTLQSQAKPEEIVAQKRFLSWPMLAILMLFGLAVAAWGWQAYKDRLDRQRQEEYLNALRLAPGIVVVSSERQNGQLLVRGLRDPLAEEPRRIAARMGFSDAEVTGVWTPYQELTPQFMEQRLRLRLQQWLNPPDSVQMVLQGTVLKLSGHADRVWIDKAVNSVGLIAGLTSVATDELIDNDVYRARSKARFNAFLKVLEKTPGIVVVADGFENGHHTVNGLLDPLAEKPAQIAKRMQIGKVSMQWTPYHDLDPRFVRQRVKQRLKPLPPSVKLHFKKGVLSLSGHASPVWINRAAPIAAATHGVKRLNTENLMETDRFLLMRAERELQAPDDVILKVENGILRVSGRLGTEAYQTLKQRIEKLRGFADIDDAGLRNTDRETYERLVPRIENAVIFFTDAAEFAPEQDKILRKLHKDLQQLLGVAQDLNLPVRLRITGHTDGVGKKTGNQQLSKRRAKAVHDWLATQGIKTQYLKVMPPVAIKFGTQKSDLRHRKVTFRLSN